MIQNRRVRRPAGYDVSSQQSKAVKAFNERMRYVQGFRAVTPIGDTTVDIKLASPGRKLLGISLVPIDATNASLGDVQVDFKVNNNNVLTSKAALGLIPNYVQGMIFFPLPQELIGNDTLQAIITRTSGTNTTIILDVFYVPRGKN